jgi:hypothetical protein
LNLAVRPSKFGFVFILASRRAGSTLLSHIITSHPDFIGAGETHTTYSTEADLPKLIPRTSQLLRRLQLKGKYIVDKITMDEYILDDQLLLSPLIFKCPILIRAPEGALKSFMNWYDVRDDVALEVYLSRLETLARYGDVLQKRALLVEYDNLLDHPDETLAALTRFFEVEQLFSGTYATHKATGKVGDASPNIFSRRIIRTRSHNVSISAEVMGNAEEAFQKCKRALLSSGVLPAIMQRDKE